MFQVNNFIPVWWNRSAEDPSPGAELRYSMYGSELTPVFMFGGTGILEEWNAVNMDSIFSAYNNIIDYNSPLEIDLEFSKNESEQYTVTANILLTADITTANNQILFLVNGWTTEPPRDPGYWNYKVLTQSDPIDMDLTSSGSSIEIIETFTNIEADEMWLEEQFRAVVIVQSMDSYQILQAEQTIFNNTPVENTEIVPLINSVQHYPNPFNPSGAGRGPEAIIRFQMLEKSFVELMIYDVKGREINNLISEQLTRGEHSVPWNGTDYSGDPVSSGIYFYIIRTKNIDISGKMILIK